MKICLIALVFVVALATMCIAPASAQATTQRLYYSSGNLESIILYDPVLMQGWTKIFYDNPGKQVWIYKTTDGIFISYAYHAATGAVQTAVTVDHNTMTRVTEEYDEDGNLLSTDTINRRRDTRDAGGRLILREMYDGRAIAFEYYEESRILKKKTVTHEGGRTVTQYFDATGRLETVVDSTTTVTRTYSGYDALNRYTRIEYSTGRVDEITYVGDTRKIAMRVVTMPDGSTQTVTYDAQNRKMRVDYPDGKYVFFQYYGDSTALKRKTVCYPSGTVAVYQYDGYGQLVSYEYPDGVLMFYSRYDDAHRVTRIDYSDGRRESRAYQGAASYLDTRVVHYIDGKTVTVTYYDLSNQRKERTVENADGSRTVYRYDEDNNLIGKDVYSAEHRKVSDTDYSSYGTAYYVESFEFDIFGNIIAERMTGGDGTFLNEFRYRYDESGVQTGWTRMNEYPYYCSPEGVAFVTDNTYEDNGLGKLCTSQQYGYSFSDLPGAAGLERVQYDLYGNIVDSYRFLSDGSTLDHVEYTYDEYHRLVVRTEYNASGVAYDVREYDRDENGNIFEYRFYYGADLELSSRTCSTFDANNNEVSTIYYDGDGNLKSPYMCVREYDSENRLVKQWSHDRDLQIDGYTIYEYDDHGNQIAERSYSLSGELEGYALVDYSSLLVSYSYYASSGKVHTETSASGRVYEYADEDWNGTGQGRLIRETASDGSYALYGSYYAGTHVARFVSNYSADGILQSTYEYNASGQLIGKELFFAESRRQSLSSYDGAGSFIYSSIKDYDSYGRYTGEWVFHEDGFGGSSVNTYMYSDQIIETIRYNPDGTANARALYTYGQDGNVAQEAHYVVNGVSGDWQVDRYRRLTYNSYGSVLEDRTYKADNALWYYSCYEYDVNNNMTLETSYYSDNGDIRLLSRTEYDYNAENLLTATRYCDSAGMVMTEFVYMYDANNNLTGRSTFDASGSMTHYSTYEYDADNNLVLYLRYTSSNVLVYRVEREYDEDGNMTANRWYGDSGALDGYEDIVYSDRKVAYTYYADSGRVYTKTTFAGLVYEYLDENWNGHAYGRLAKETFYNGTYKMYSDYYAGTDQARFIEQYDADGTLQATYEYDIDGNLVGTTTPLKATSYYLPRTSDLDERMDIQSQVASERQALQDAGVVLYPKMATQESEAALLKL